MSNFTPWPWQIHDTDYCHEEIWGDMEFTDGASSGTHVCSMNKENPGWRENARLIAASPKLLDVLQRVLKITIMENQEPWRVARAVTLLNLQIKEAIHEALGTS